MRIISGSHKGKKLFSPISEATRPTSDRPKEALFNLIENYLKENNLKWPNIIFADIFAGSGAIGVEALSRGAKQVFFVDENNLAIKIIKKNTAIFKNYQIFEGDIKKMHLPFSNIIFMDPPYAMQDITPILKILEKNKTALKNTLFIWEKEKSTPIPFPFLFKKNYGIAEFVFFKIP